MSKDCISNETKIIDNIGILKTKTFMDDWNRYEHYVTLESDTHHIESKIISRPAEPSYSIYYVVPNGHTINNELDLPNIPNEPHYLELAKEFKKDYLIEKFKQISGKRAKFEEGMNDHIALGKICWFYFRKNKNGNREHCKNCIKLAIENFDDYEFNYDKWYKICNQATKDKNQKDYQVIEMSYRVV
ncbi:hypothetical protein [Carnobacterium maltaromaticum]|uniref:hypothetical protein n=1 Tax=Carnobacterium maltaromaticum TaxID=2751 RepID=UPI0012FCC78D|nr:hypothetical protein [Carnobacterium maltaromaticum]CAD5903211.1 hypothetical protein CMALT394_690004 [Carnobacterium maltaromaticum]